jgi:putative lipoic acid-binding regulatory protein
MSEERKTLLEFPCDFPLKIMGNNHPEMTTTITSVVITHAPDFDETTIEVRESSKGNYLSLTCTVRATSQQQLDDLYRALTSHPMVKVVL